MKKIPSFQIDHTILEKGIYISRIDDDITTYDIRMRAPNREPVMTNASMHTIEHLFATYVRNTEFGDNIIYFGPMGCRTGFYLLLSGDLSSRDVLPLVTECFRFIRDYRGEVPGASPKDCGNYLDMNLSMANYWGKKYTALLENITPDRLTYPE